MCLILFGYRTLPGIDLVIAANRDEFHQRAAAQADYWEDAQHVLAGRDLVAGGTWLGCTVSGRFAALTNFSNPDDPETPRSRGELVSGFLTGKDGAEHYAHAIRGSEYAGFNLLVFDGTDLVYTSNRGTTEILTPGYYGLSNAELGARWPKCVQGAANLQSIVEAEYTDEDLINLLADQHIPSDDELPHRGRPIEMERKVAPCFINGDEYGTRASTLVRVSARTVHFVEQCYLAGGVASDRTTFDLERSEP